MELINATRMVAGYTMGLEPSGRELLVVVIKGTLPHSAAGEPAGHFALHDEQLPLVMADTFTGEPGFSAPGVRGRLRAAQAALRHPADRQRLCTARPAADARRGRLAGRQLEQASRGGRPSALGMRPGDRARVVARRLPGADRSRMTWPSAGRTFCTTIRREHAAFMANPVGRGFHKHLQDGMGRRQAAAVDRRDGRTVRDPSGDYRPMAFGPVGRGWRAALSLCRHLRRRMARESLSVPAARFRRAATTRPRRRTSRCR